MPHTKTDSENDSVNVNIRIDRATWDRFKLAAKADRRSAASLLRLLIAKTGDQFEAEARGEGGAR